MSQNEGIEENISEQADKVTQSEHHRENSLRETDKQRQPEESGIRKQSHRGLCDNNKRFVSSKTWKEKREGIAKKKHSSNV